MRKFILMIWVLVAACNGKIHESNHIAVDRQHQAVTISGLPSMTLNGIKHDSLTTQNFQTLFPVYKMPADTEMRNYQNPLKGKYLVSDSFISFKPDTPFVPGQTYFARWYRYDQDISAADIIINKQKPGQTTYSELIFKY